MPRVLVTDASERAALAVIRSLGRRNIDVVAGDSTRFNVGFLSKYCKQKILYPAAELQKTKFVKAMLKLVKEKSFDLLIPVTDTAMVPIIERKEDFEQYTRVASPRYTTAMKALDKIQTLKLARQLNIPYPETRFGEDVDDIDQFSKDIAYPVVVRPRMKVTWIGEKALILKVTQNNYAYNAEDFITKWNRLVSILKRAGLEKDFLMVQEFVKGAGYGVEILMHEGQARVVFSHKRLREYPTTGGASTLRESVRAEGLEQSGIKLLQALGWEGVAMVEFRVNENTGKPELIEINGRFWGSLPLAINSGVDFPYLLYKSMIGEDFASPSYITGLKQRWLAGDFLWLYSSLINGDGIVRSVREFLRSVTVPDDIMALRDSAPVCGQILFTLVFLSEVVSGHRSLAGEVVP